MDTPHILLSPDLDLSADEFAAAWNAMPECNQIATASVGPASTEAKQFDPMLAAAGVVVLGLAGQVALGLATNALYDLLKDRVLKALRKKNPHTTAEVEVLPQPDGRIVIVVHAGGATRP